MCVISVTDGDVFILFVVIGFCFLFVIIERERFPFSSFFFLCYHIEEEIHVFLIVVVFCFVCVLYR